MKKNILIQLAIIFVFLFALVYCIHQAESHVKIQINGKSYFIKEASLTVILDQAQQIAQDEENQLRLKLDQEFDTVFKIIDQNLEAYLNWNYSVVGSISQSILFAAVIGTKVVNHVVYFDQEKMNQLETEIKKRLFTQELTDALEKKKETLDQFRYDSSTKMGDFLEKEVKAKQNFLGRFSYLINHDPKKDISFSTQLSSLANHEMMNPSFNKFGLSIALSGTVLLFKNQIVKHLIPQFAERLVISIAEKLVINGSIKMGLATAGIGTSTVAATLTCGPLCGAVAAIGTFVISEYMANQIDQYFNRDELKLKFINIFVQIKQDSINTVVAQYQALNQVLFAKNDQPQKAKVKMIDVLLKNSKQ